MLRFCTYSSIAILSICWFGYIQNSNKLARTSQRFQTTTSDLKLEWLHTPKTGSSFGNVVIHWACPELHNVTVVTSGGVKEETIPTKCKQKIRPGRYQGDNNIWWIGYHYSLTNFTIEELQSVVTMVRWPRRRLASAYHMFNGDKPRATAKEMCEYLTAEEPHRQAHGTLGAQVKMIAGIPLNYDPGEMGSPGVVKNWFSSTALPSKDLVEKACNRLHQFAFVGITDFYDASVCLFYQMFGGAMSPADLINVRPGRYNKESDALTSVDCGDTADEILFTEALALFLKNLEQHRQCIHYITDVTPFGVKAVDDMMEKFLDTNHLFMT